LPCFFFWRMKPKGLRENTRAHSAPTEVRLKLKPPGAPTLVPSPSPFDPPAFQLPGSPSLPTRRLEEKILSRSAPTRLRRITPLDDLEQNRSETVNSPIGSETSSNITPTGSPTIYALLHNRGQPARQSDISKLGFGRKLSLDSPQSSPRGSPDRVRNRRGTGGTSSRQKVEFGLAMASEPGRGLQPEKASILPNESSTEGVRKFSIGDLQFQMDQMELPGSRKEFEDKRKEADETLDFLQNLEF